MERYRRFLPVTDATPAADARRRRSRRSSAADGSARRWASRNLYLKVEGQNPTGSFKDRGMVVAVAKAAEAGARAIVCASTGNTSASAAAYGAAAGHGGHRRPAEGPDRDRQAAPGARRRRAGRGHRRQLRPGARDRPGARRAGRPPRDPGQLGQPVPPRRPEDGGVRDLRRPRPGAGRAGHPGRQRRQHQRLLGRLPRLRGGRRDRARRPGCGASRRPAPRRSCVGHRVEHPETVATAIRIGDPASWTKAVEARDESAGRITRGDRRRDPGRVPRAGAATRASSASRRRRRASRASSRPPRPASWTRTRPSCAS